MSIDINNPYVRNQVLTAPPETLRLLLLDGCLRFIRDGKRGLEEKNYEAVYEGFSQAKDILLELITSMDREANPEVCNNLAAIYTFVFNRLTEASFQKDIEIADECISIMDFERETWALVIEKMHGGGGDADVPHEALVTTEPAKPAAVPGPGPGAGSGTYAPPSGSPQRSGLSFSA